MIDKISKQLTKTLGEIILNNLLILGYYIDGLRYIRAYLTEFMKPGVHIIHVMLILLPNG
jgi:hypothetical protein